MNKRTLATFLWFNVGWTAGAMATFFLGMPDGLSWVVAIILAAVVWWDPTHLLWPQGRRIVNVDRTAEITGTPHLAAD